ncbi:MAG: Holliday junction branch migration protein RuvA [Eubacteriales bacterium]|nr:Holliday junction branch migration protein RuvA [Eubacteriales bacterium]
MYAYIRGIIDEVLSDRAIVDVGGVGYLLFCSTNSLNTLVKGSEGKLFTYLHLADGVMALYGFADLNEKEMFQKLIGVSRIGPKLAISVLSVLTPNDVYAAVMTDNPSAFDHVSGLGRKTAQRIILELHESVGSMQTQANEYNGKTDMANDIRSEAVAALTSLGYDGLSATRAVAAIDQADSVEELLTKALRSMAR